MYSTDERVFAALRAPRASLRLTWSDSQPNSGPAIRTATLDALTARPAWPSVRRAYCVASTGNRPCIISALLATISPKPAYGISRPYMAQDDRQDAPPLPGLAATGGAARRAGALSPQAGFSATK